MNFDGNLVFRQSGCEATRTTGSLKSSGCDWLEFRESAARPTSTVRGARRCARRWPASRLSHCAVAPCLAHPGAYHFFDCLRSVAHRSPKARQGPTAPGSSRTVVASSSGRGRAPNTPRGQPLPIPGRSPAGQAHPGRRRRVSSSSGPSPESKWRRRAAIWRWREIRSGSPDWRINPLRR